VVKHGIYGLAAQRTADHGTTAALVRSRRLTLPRRLLRASLKRVASPALTENGVSEHRARRLSWSVQDQLFLENFLFLREKISCAKNDGVTVATTGQSVQSSDTVSLCTAGLNRNKDGPRQDDEDKKKPQAKLESTASRRVGASQGKCDHQNGRILLVGSFMKSKAYSKRWLSWNLQPRTAEGASQCASEPPILLVGS